MKKENKLLKTEEVNFDEFIYPRDRWSQATVYQYMEAMKQGAVFPPITVAWFDDDYVLIDGKHRLESHTQKHTEYIQAEVIYGLSKKQIYLEAIKRNVSHGIRFDDRDKRKIVKKLTSLKLESNEISKLLYFDMRELDRFMPDKFKNILSGEELKNKEGEGGFKGFDIKGNETKEKDFYGKTMGQFRIFKKGGTINLVYIIRSTHSKEELKRFINVEWEIENYN